MARRQRFILCLIEDHRVLLDRVESLPPWESWCGQKGELVLLSLPISICMLEPLRSNLQLYAQHVIKTVKLRFFPFSLKDKSRG